jgi:hypothetical protein
MKSLVSSVTACVTWLICTTACPGQEIAVQEVERLNVPAKLLPEGSKVLFVLRAEGVQVYKGEQKGEKLQWVLDGPRAVLLDFDTGEKVGDHSRGPIWDATDGSRVSGKLMESAPSPRARAVPWLLLKATAKGDGRFAPVTHIGRVDTWGGQAPAQAPSEVGATREVHYHATYIFFGQK